MPHFDFIWTPENIAHILEHGVSLEEAEDVVCFPDFTSTNLVTDASLPMARQPLEST